jgi:transcriptional regulator with XRE-family HTH domain
MKTLEMNKIDKNIMNNLNTFIQLRGVKKSDLADHLNTSTASISRFCSGKSTPTDEQIVLICEFLNISLYQLFGLEDPTNLSDDELKIIEACRKNSETFKYVKKICEIK